MNSPGPGVSNGGGGVGTQQSNTELVPFPSVWTMEAIPRAGPAHSGPVFTSDKLGGWDEGTKAPRLQILAPMSPSSPSCIFRPNSYNLEILQPGLSGHWSSWSWKNQLGLFFFQLKETTKVTVFSILCVFLWQNQTGIGCLADSQERSRKQPWVTCLRVHPSSYQTPAGCRDAVSRVLRQEAMSSWAPHTSPGALRVSLPWGSPYRRMRLGCSERDCPECM